MNSSPKGESIKTTFKPISKNNIQHVMHEFLNQIKASKLDQMSSFLQEHDEFIEYDQKMDMHVRKHGLQPQNSLIQTCMHEMSFNPTLMNQIMT